MGYEFIDPPLERQLETKLELYQDLHKQYYEAKGRVKYLGGWLFRLSNDLSLLRHQIKQQQHPQQLEAFDKDDYHVVL